MPCMGPLECINACARERSNVINGLEPIMAPLAPTIVPASLIAKALLAVSVPSIPRIREHAALVADRAHDADVRVGAPECDLSGGIDSDDVVEAGDSTGGAEIVQEITCLG